MPIRLAPHAPAPELYSGSIVDVALEYRLATINFVASPEYLTWLKASQHANDAYPTSLRHNKPVVTAYPWTLDVRTNLDILGSGETYAISEQCAKLIEQGAQTLPTTTLTRELLPSPAGFMWFERGLLVGNAVDSGERLKGITWTPATWEGSDAAIAIEAWFSAPLLHNRHPQALVAGGFMPWPFGSNTTDISAMDPTEQRLIERLFTSFCLFVKQRILTHSVGRITRAARRRFQASKHAMLVDPLVNVVQLRAREHHASYTTEHEEVDWQCRWLVRGHWRQQWYPSRNAYEPKWIAPYVKGPEDKPLKDGSAARAFAVVR